MLQKSFLPKIALCTLGIVCTLCTLCIICTRCTLWTLCTLGTLYSLYFLYSLYSLYSFLSSLNTLPHQRIALFAGLGSARVLVRLASSSWGSRPYLVVQIVHLRRSKYQQRRCHKERREVLCATNDSTLVYEYHYIHLSTTNRECPSWASVHSKTPKSLIIRTLTRKSILTRQRVYNYQITHHIMIIC